MFEIFPGTDLNEVLRQMKDKVLERFAMLQRAVGSGWALINIVDVRMRFANFQSLAGSSYVKLPEVITKKHAVINILNKNDDECFKWAVTQALNPIGKDAGHITKKLKNDSLPLMT